MKSEEIKAIISNLGRVAAVSIVMLLLLSPQSASAQLANSPWPMLHGGPQHGGLSPYDTSHVDGTLKWSLDTKHGIEASPVIGPDGTIYIATHGNNLHAVSPNGKEKWKFDAGEPLYDKLWDSTKGILSTPAIDKDGTVYFTSLSNFLFAVKPNGKEKWRYPVHVFTNTWSSPVIGKDGTIYVGSEQHPHGPGKVQMEIGARLYAINSDGTLKWHFELPISGISSSPAIDKNGIIYSSGYDQIDPERDIGNGLLYALNPDSSIKWEFRTEDWQESSAAIGPNGIIYIGSKEGKVYAIKSDGTKKWDFQTGDGVSAIPAIGKDGTIYVGSWDCNMYALTPNGKEKWRFKTPKAFEGVSASAAIGKDGTIYFGSNSGYFYALKPDGTKKWSFLSKKGGIVASPAIGKDGTVYIASWDHKLYAFGGPPVEEIPENVENIESEEETTEDIPITRVIGILGVLAIALAISIFSVLRKRKLKK